MLEWVMSNPDIKPVLPNYGTLGAAFLGGDAIIGSHEISYMSL